MKDKICVHLYSNNRILISDKGVCKKLIKLATDKFLWKKIVDTPEKVGFYKGQKRITTKDKSAIKAIQTKKCPGNCVPGWLAHYFVSTCFMIEIISIGETCPFKPIEYAGSLQKECWKYDKKGKRQEVLLRKNIYKIAWLYLILRYEGVTKAKQVIMEELI